MNMVESYYFHDGNVVSFTVTTMRRSAKCRLVLDLYRDSDASERSRYTFTFRQLRTLRMEGDFVEFARNYFAGIIVDGLIEEISGVHELSLELTGGILKVEGLMSVVSQH